MNRHPRSRPSVSCTSSCTVSCTSLVVHSFTSWATNNGSFRMGLEASFFSGLHPLLTQIKCWARLQLHTFSKSSCGNEDILVDPNEDILVSPTRISSRPTRISSLRGCTGPMHSSSELQLSKTKIVVNTTIYCIPKTGLVSSCFFIHKMVFGCGKLTQTGSSDGWNVLRDEISHP